MPSASTHKLICEYVQTGIRALSLDGIASAQVHVLWGINPDITVFPAIFVCAAGSESVIGGTNARDDISYPVVIYDCDRKPAEDGQFMDAALLRRSRIRKLFINQHLSAAVSGGPASVYTCRVEGSPILDVAILAAFQMLVHPLALSFISREARGST